ncbi:MAG: hypothetical protein IPG96_01285 [Proteobacteria bacterium]|nr:hypothetical protein [Pseudomonadota bacterium]
MRELMQVDKRREFERCNRSRPSAPLAAPAAAGSTWGGATACTGCLVNFDDLARDSGVSAATVSGWGGVGRAGYFSSLKAWVH